MVPSTRLLKGKVCNCRMSKAQHFDPHQFAGRHMRPVNAHPTSDGWASPNIAFEDYARMSTKQHKPSGERRLPTPKWAVNDAMLQKLLVTFMEERAGFRKLQHGTLLERLQRARMAVINQRPRTIALLDKLCGEYVRVKRMGTMPGITDDEINGSLNQPFCFAEDARRYVDYKRRRELEIEIEGLDTYLRISENGGADVIAAVVFLFYRVGLDSVGVAAELNLKPPHCRQLLYRLYETAAKLWPAEASQMREVLATLGGGKRKREMAIGQSQTVPAITLAIPPMFVIMK